jgi:hypothetical protein
MNPIAIGRLLRSNTAGCVVGCRVNQKDAPTFGQMVRINLGDGFQVYGLVHDIHIDDDGLVRQLVTAPGISEEVIEDNRQNRNMPVEMSVVFIGWEQNGRISQTRVPRPPLSLDEIFPSSADEIVKFVKSGKFGYFRSLLRDLEIPAADLLAAHLRQIHETLKNTGSNLEIEEPLREVIALLKDDYPQLMDVLSAVSEIL